MGGEDEVKEVGINAFDTGYSGAELEFCFSGVDARPGKAKSCFREMEERRGRHSRGIQFSVRAGGGDASRAEERADNVTDGNADDDVVDDAVPDARVHGHRPLPGVGHLTQARARGPMCFQCQTTDRPPFHTYVRSVLPSHY